MENIKTAILAAVKELYGESKAGLEITRPEVQFGDYSTNIAMKLSKALSRSPRDIASEIIEYIKTNDYPWLAKIEIAGPGFINIFVTDSELFNSWSLTPSELFKDKIVIAEYSDPNPFKTLHAGHLYTTLVGDAIANLVEAAGGKVSRLNYGGDVGLHVAKAMFGIINNIGGELPEKLNEIDTQDRLNWISQRYIEGNLAYEADENAKQQIIEINKRVYEIHNNSDTTSDFAQIYWTCRGWSYSGFEQLYKDLMVKPFKEYIPESKVTPVGLQLVNKGLERGVFVESNGAVIFKGEDYGLHTRVFINSNGLPVYETKEIGLANYKWENYKFDKSIVITGNDIVEYMKVVLKAISNFHPEVSERTTHLTHGMIKLVGGQKMSSRTGNVLTLSDIISAARQANREISGNDDDTVAIGAIKYAFLKQRTGGDIIYDPQESISLQGNSGPYLQYSHARAKSILAKSSIMHYEFVDLTVHERLLAGSLVDFNYVINKATEEFSPHLICTYLYELAQTFNRFYENSKVIGDPREALRIELVRRYAETLKTGLTLLGINAPDKM